MLAAWVADQELESIRRHTREGLEQARQQGNTLGPPKPIPRWGVHFGELDDDRKESTVPHITSGPQLGGHR